MRLKQTKRIPGIFAVILVSLMLLGVEGCPMQTGAAKTGLDFALVSGVGKLSEGIAIGQGDTFNVHVYIENYDEKARSGEICIRDDIDKASGGIESQCMSFFVKAAEVTREKKGYFSPEKIQPATAEIYFPASGEYSYHDLAITQTAKARISLKYAQSSRIEAPEGIKVPEPAEEIVKLEQEPAPVTASVEKSISKKEDAYKIALGIQLTKERTATLLSPANEENYIYFKVSMPPKILACELSDIYDKAKFMQGLVELKNTKFIKCSALVDIAAQQQYQFFIDLNYNVKIDKEIPFTIKVEKQ